jgi:NitT/TauT family transport system substrate-binding protein
MTRRGVAAELTPLRVTCVPDVTGLPAWVAKDRGLFQNNGLDVSLIAAQHIALEGLGDSDIAAATPPEVVKAWEDGIDVAAVAGEAVETRDNPITHLIVRAGSAIRTVTDLKGRTVAFPAFGTAIHVATLYLLKQSGIDPAAVYAVQMAPDAMANDLKAGSVDAIAVGEPMAGELLAAGNRSIGDPLFSVGDEVASLFWVSRRRWSQRNAEVIAAFVAALEQARDAIAADPGAARQVLAAYAKLATPVVERTPFPTYRFTTNFDARRWAAILKDVGEPARRRSSKDQAETRRRPASGEDQRQVDQRPSDQRPEATAAVETRSGDAPRPDTGSDTTPERSKPERRRRRRSRGLPFPLSLFPH